MTNKELREFLENLDRDTHPGLPYHPGDDAAYRAATSSARRAPAKKDDNSALYFVGGALLFGGGFVLPHIWAGLLIWLVFGLLSWSAKP
ncbi:hypothetical protein [Paraburkholderia oxyphila]|uniref:hypothetical protein n=1 Tax=Paraburkholderia oxyphila TaxID=614212 RepID=UPI0004892589|nr:hypothetical protein [Paraburkholderia oxyphila]